MTEFKEGLQYKTFYVTYTCRINKEVQCQFEVGYNIVYILNKIKGYLFITLNSYTLFIY